MTVQKEIIAFLTDKHNYESFDDVLIDRVKYLLYVLKEAEKDVVDNGIKESDRFGNTKANPSITIVKQTSDKLESLFMALGLTPRERNKLKLKALEISDGFDD